MNNKRISILVLCTLLLAPLRAQNQNPQWVHDLANKNATLIDSIAPYAPDTTAPEYSSYIIYYHQPLSHATPQGAQCPMRAVLIVDNRQDPTLAVNHVYFSGYNITEDYLQDPNSTLKLDDTDSMNEITRRYRCNMILPEHRYFAYSAPYQCWTNLDYCTADEASQDFHALFEAMKKVFKGKWVINGVSKGGITTTLQHMYYPEDADIFMPYSAPFFDTDRDTVMQQYWYNTGWTQEYRDLFMNVRKQGLVHQKDAIYRIFEKMNAGNDSSPAHLDSIYGLYLSSIAQFGFDEHAYSDTATIRKQIHDNDSILHLFGMPYNDTVYAFMLSRSTFSLKRLRPWLDTLRKYPDEQNGPKHVERLKLKTPFGITRDEWYSSDSVPLTAYPYQSKCELGYYDCRWDEIVGQEKAAELNAYWQSHFGCLCDFNSPFFASLTFSRSLYGRLTAATQNATKPVLFLYGEDDTWTGAAMKDEFINGSNVRKFILPAQNHNVYFMSKTDPAQCNEIMRILDEVLGTPQGVETVGGEPRTTVRKMLIDGQLVLIVGNERYSVTGGRLR